MVTVVPVAFFVAEHAKTSTKGPPDSKLIVGLSPPPTIDHKSTYHR